MMRRLLTALLAMLALAPADVAGAQARSAPSLLRRPVEGRDRDAEVRAAEAAAAALAAERLPEDGALAAEVSGLGAKSAAAVSSFDGLLPAGQRSAAAARGSAPGAEAWVVAEQAISRLDAARYDSVAALAALDTLYVERTNAADIRRANTDADTIDRVRGPVLAAVDRQNDRLDDLRAGLSEPRP